MLLLRGMRWWVLCRDLQLRVGLLEALRLYVVSSFFAAATPARLGDLVKAFCVRSRRSRDGLAAAVTSVVCDRLLDLGPVLIVGLGAMELLPGWRHGGFIASSLAAVVFLVCTSWSPLARRLVATPLGLVLRRFGARSAVDLPFPSSPAILGSHLLSAAAMAAFGAQTVVLARGLGIQGTSAWALVVLTALGAIAGSLPVSFLGIGTRDAVFAAAAESLHQSPQTMLGLSLLLLALYALNAAIGGLLWIVGPSIEGLPKFDSRAADA